MSIGFWMIVEFELANGGIESSETIENEGKFDSEEKSTESWLEISSTGWGFPDFSGDSLNRKVRNFFGSIRIVVGESSLRK